MQEFDLTGKVAIVTGGSRGIGRGIALGLSRAGASVVIAARDEARNAQTVKEITDQGGKAIGVVCDVTNVDDVERTVAAAVSEFGGLSILVNNAGMAPKFRPPQVRDDANWDSVFDTNLKATMSCCIAAYPALCEAGGKIINISSMSTRTSYETGLAYGASKAGVEYVTRTLAVTWGPKNIQVNAIVPGVVPTEMMTAFDDEATKARVVRHTPARRGGDAEEFGAIAVFLASRASDFITGQSLLVDGGLSIMTAATVFRRE